MITLTFSNLWGLVVDFPTMLAATICFDTDPDPNIAPEIYVNIRVKLPKISETVEIYCTFDPHETKLLCDKGVLESFRDKQIEEVEKAIDEAISRYLNQ